MAIDSHWTRFLNITTSQASAYADQVLSTIGPFVSKPIRDLSVLDVGCAYGAMPIELARHCRRVVGLEPSETLWRGAVEKVRSSGMSNVTIQLGAAEWLNETAAYDLIVLFHVLEHVEQQRAALAAIARALTPGGVLFLVAPNKWWPIEQHYGLPFLSYLPLSIANWYVRVARRASDYRDASYSPTYTSLLGLFREHPELSFHFEPPADINLTSGGAAFHYRLGIRLLKRFPALWRISKSFLVIAVKEGGLPYSAVARGETHR